MIPEPQYNGRKTSVIPLNRRLTVGRGEGVEVFLDSQEVSPRQATIEPGDDGFTITDIGSNGGLLNGRFFHRAQLIVGDRLQFGPYAFVFTGNALRAIADCRGAAVAADGLNRSVRIHPKGTPFWTRKRLDILKGASAHVGSGQFVGILGPSGAGKTTLLKALAGLQKSDRGSVTVNGVDLYRHYDRLSPGIGFVPQEDIVHSGLAIRDALSFSAQLRLPKSTPESEIRRLVEDTVERVGLSERIDTRIGDLSGGQRKRVNVATELLTRPDLLFLDEPTSGLDPATELELMELLRKLSDAGCTVICTTHLMENVFLMDAIVVVMSGKTIFEGPASSATSHFEVPSLIKLYQQLKTKPADHWAKVFEARPKPEDSVPTAKIDSAVGKGFKAGIESMTSAIKILLNRKTRMLLADWKSPALLLFQPLLIGALIAWIVPNPATAMFLAYIAALWLGCSNAAQEIIREISIFRRERHAGLGRHTYLLSKFTYLTCVTAIQSLLIYACVRLFGEIEGNVAWQILALILCAFSGAGIGLAVSAFSRSVAQAVMIVPLVLIPQLLFSSYVVPAAEWRDSSSAKSAARFFPSFQAQRIADVSHLWSKTIDSTVASDPATEIAVSNLDEDSPLTSGEEFREFGRGFGAAFALAAWTLTGYFLSWFGLRRAEAEA